MKWIEQDYGFIGCDFLNCFKFFLQFTQLINSEFHQLVIMLFHHSVVQFSLIFKLYVSIFLSLSSHFDQSPMFDY